MIAVIELVVVVSVSRHPYNGRANFERMLSIHASEWRRGRLIGDGDLELDPGGCQLSPRVVQLGCAASSSRLFTSRQPAPRLDVHSRLAPLVSLLGTMPARLVLLLLLLNVAMNECTLV